MWNSGAQALPKAVLGRFLELCSSCLLHRISSYPSGAPEAGCPAPPCLAGAARTARVSGGGPRVGGAAAGHSGNLRWTRTMKPGFWFRFGRQAAKQTQSAQTVTQTPWATAPLGGPDVAFSRRAGDRQQGRGQGRSPGPGPGQRRVCLCQGGSSREAGCPPLPVGRGPGPRRLPHAHADSPATRSRELTAWSRGGAALSRGQALAVALTRRPLGPGTIPSFRPRSLIAEEGARCLRPLRTVLEGRPRPLVGPGSRRVPRVLT